MAKKERDEGHPDVVWQLSHDGMEPRRTEWGFLAVNPLEVAVPPGKKMRINTYVSANVPLLVMPSRSHAEDVTVESMIVSPGQDIVCYIENRSGHLPMTVGDREALVSIFPMVFKGPAVVG